MKRSASSESFFQRKCSCHLLPKEEEATSPQEESIDLDEIRHFDRMNALIREMPRQQQQHYESHRYDPLTSFQSPPLIQFNSEPPNHVPKPKLKRQVALSIQTMDDDGNSLEVLVPKSPPPTPRNLNGNAYVPETPPRFFGWKEDTLADFEFVNRTRIPGVLFLDDEDSDDITLGSQDTTEDEEEHPLGRVHAQWTPTNWRWVNALGRFVQDRETV